MKILDHAGPLKFWGQTGNIALLFLFSHSLMLRIAIFDTQWIELNGGEYPSKGYGYSGCMIQRKRQFSGKLQLWISFKSAINIDIVCSLGVWVFAPFFYRIFVICLLLKTIWMCKNRWNLFLNFCAFKKKLTESFYENSEEFRGLIQTKTSTIHFLLLWTCSTLNFE